MFHLIYTRSNTEYYKGDVFESNYTLYRNIPYSELSKFLEDNPRFSRFICFYPQYLVCYKNSILLLVHQRRFDNHTSFVFHQT